MYIDILITVLCNTCQRVHSILKLILVARSCYFNFKSYIWMWLVNLFQLTNVNSIQVFFTLACFIRLPPPVFITLLQSCRQTWYCDSSFDVLPIIFTNLYIVCCHSVLTLPRYLFISTSNFLIIKTMGRLNHTITIQATVQCQRSLNNGTSSMGSRVSAMMGTFIKW